MDFDYLKRVREYEMKRVLPLMTPGETVLEIGAGAGWQSQMMADYGLRVISVDLPSTNYRALQDYAVIAYDGYRLPIQSHSVDVIFSSNVLEHIAHVEAFQAELHRVLKPGGKALHILPTTTWRLWTSLAHPFYYLSRGLRHLLGRKVISNAAGGEAASAATASLSFVTKLRRALIPDRHGETGTALSELYSFNQRRWRSLFAQTGWTVERCFPNGLFYSGYALRGSQLSFPARERLSKLLGASCMIYVLGEKAPRGE